MLWVWHCLGCVNIVGKPKPICPEDTLEKSESFPNFALCPNEYWKEKSFSRTYDKKAIEKGLKNSYLNHDKPF